MKKYMLTTETVKPEYGPVLHRIKALRSFGDVKEGELGGFIESEENLSHDGECWVYDNSMVYYSRVLHNGRVSKDSKVISSWVIENANICNSEVITVCIDGNADIEKSDIRYSNIGGSVKVCGSSLEGVTLK